MTASSAGFVLLADVPSVWTLGSIEESAKLGSLASVGEVLVADVSVGKSWGSSPVELCLSE